MKKKRKGGDSFRGSKQVREKTKGKRAMKIMKTRDSKAEWVGEMIRSAQLESLDKEKSQ